MDLDKQFSDEIAALNNKTHSILYGSVSDRQDLTTGNPGQAVLRVIYETLASNTIYALMSIRFSNNGVSYTLPIFDVDPSEHSFRIYNDGALQKYQITLSGSTYTFTQVENISNTIFISDNAASNKTTVSNLSGYSVHNTQNIYNYYTSAGGTKTEDEFKAKLVQLIDA